MTLNEYIEQYPSPKTQAEWAIFFGLSQPFLCQILGGKRRPRYPTMLRIERRTRGAVPVSAWSVGIADEMIEPRKAAEHKVA